MRNFSDFKTNKDSSHSRTSTQRVVNRRLPTAAMFGTILRHVEFVLGEMSLGADFLRALQFFLPIPIQPIPPRSSVIYQPGLV
jgi:hypothetical protein